MESTKQPQAPYERSGFFMARLVNPIAKAIGAPTLTVSGRKSGLPRAVPLNPFEYRGAVYVIGGGGDTNWARNLRAAGKGLLRIRRTEQQFRAIELHGEERDRIVIAFATQWGREHGLSSGRYRILSITLPFASTSFWRPLRQKRRPRSQGLMAPVGHFCGQEEPSTEMGDMKVRLSTLWLFATLNYIYCDVVTVLDPAHNSPIALTQGFLLGASVLVEIPIAMALVSRVLPYRANRWANLIAAGVMVVVQLASLFVAVPTMYYVFFSVIEIATTAGVVWFAWRWRNEASARIGGQQANAATPGLSTRMSS